MRSYTITNIWGIPIRVNTSLLIFLPILAWLIGSGQQIELYAGLIGGLTGTGFDLATLRAGSTPWLIGLLAAVGLFVSVTIHELGHSWVAMRYGLEIESITLWILGGLAALKTFPKEWNREFWIAIAGPITSILVAAVCYGAVLVAPNSLQVSRFVLGWLAVTNVVLAGFNLLPAFPMDGGRILRALLARSRPYGTATRLAARVGVLFAFLFAIVAVLNFQIILLLLAFFIYGAATTESKAVLLDELLEGLTVGDIMTQAPATVDATATIEAFGSQLLRDRTPVHLVLDEAGSPVGVVTLDDLKTASRRDHATTTVGEIMRDVPRIGPSDDAFDTLVALQGSGNLDAIVQRDGELVGLLSEADYAHAMTIQRGFRSGIGG
ncbi:site-2 protease family protein [Haloplanus aerogenes]|uniref:Zinc metalloprotease n=1 Tax=Haloplanus aerogenes TaxID=660522 RepID=A0A3M0DQ60_9EURY|nr:site-2 protease family protein [Haloplanus aerogenes]AZH24509.1 site-2 protease family protein [Haloplanus aerogenes]RMB23842.1 Zn-dependent protease [Haloplanus aerogenes]